jgi:4-hydroxy-3-methylbut-2-enyl diphosphate reductase IspH
MSSDHSFFIGIDSHQESSSISSSKSDQERLQAKAQRMQNRGTASKNHSAKLFQTKYSNEQLEKIEEILKQFQVG